VRTPLTVAFVATVVAVIAAATLVTAQRTGSESVGANREFQLLWPNGAPGALGGDPIDRPKITVYRPLPAKANGAAVIICPGGGYNYLATDHEGKQVAEWLNSFGVSAFVLEYRIGPRYRYPAPLLDAQRAVRMVRVHAGEWGIDPTRVGILGFSAGGHLASSVITHFDMGQPTSIDPTERVSSRPDFAILIYPVISMMDPITHVGSRRNLLGEAPDPKLVELLSNERQVTAQTPSTFIFHAADDPVVPVENSLEFFAALKKAGVPGAELHVFAHGAHGVGLASQDPILSLWTKLCDLWMQSRGLLQRSGPSAVPP
jgi:acetyl esterase/lipase